ncbi:5-(carboxyamino)imidazole ribonucleotide synthase [Teredinibacter sp. KSP-S5-2]|uniref:5-(carboxyamino)imidazole ribonucleotide synthase n=1 Tax=Teredinibacter sp. KSP-S5-2 TaxID=3034506 RepID=UPI0029343ECA|nr:5-(carboxyamino)imidazole ribonucleotide synthase [Teredinibacter sp. KSP-S5-2]WNO11507.1 5-(carboxyamino)imidazole ribonucleotide synthase [Teredinibacter sp. KSP-S5-2]
MHVAIIGGGQLARMLALAGWPMGIKFSFLVEQDESIQCVEGLGTIVRLDSSHTPQQIFEDLGQPDLVTVERESVDVVLLKGLGEFCPAYPNERAVWLSQNRIREKEFLRSLSIPTADFFGFHGGDSIESQISMPVVIKSTEFGYDGKHQWLIKTEDDLKAFQALGLEGEFIAESWVPFDKEVSMIAARSVNGEVCCYPLTENVHKQGILSTSIAPAEGLTDALENKAEGYAQKILEEMDYVGVLAVECFQVGDQLLVNELAPRVHNSGHWTQNGSLNSQFENHLRALCGFPLGDTSVSGYTGMVNILGGNKLPSSEELIASHANVHWYNKTPKMGRKLGHVNLNYADLGELKQAMQAVLATVDD